MDIKLWGRKTSVDNNITLIRKKGSKFLYEVEIIQTNDNLTYNVKLILPNNETFLSFTDIQNKDFNSLNSFTRYIGSNEYYFVDGNLDLRLNPRKTSFLEQDKTNLEKNL